MACTVRVIDTEEKFNEKFGVTPNWNISIPQNNETKPQAEKMRGVKSKKKRNEGT